MLQRYGWPGNVRELENVIERAVVLSRSRTLDAASFSFLDAGAPAEVSAGRTLRQVEEAHIASMLREQNGNVTRTAAVLGINRVTLHKKIKRYGLQTGASESE
jgi:two-component system response regulator HydG